VEVEELASTLKALGHVSRLKILATLTEKKLREAGLVETRVMLLEDEARALRFYTLKDFHIELSPEKLKRRKEVNGL